MKLIKYFVLVSVLTITMSCTPSQTTTIWLMDFQSNRSVDKNDLSKRVLGKFKFLKYGSEDHEFVKLGGVYTKKGKQGLTVWISNKSVKVFAGENIGADENDDLRIFLIELEKLIEIHGVEVNLTSSNPLGFYIQ